MKISELTTRQGPLNTDSDQDVLYSSYLIVNYAQTSLDTPTTKKMNIDDIGHTILGDNKAVLYVRDSSIVENPDRLKMLRFTDSSPGFSMVDIPINSIIAKNITDSQGYSHAAVDDVISNHIINILDNSASEMEAVDSIIESIISDNETSAYYALHNEIAQHILDIADSSNECDAINAIISGGGGGASNTLEIANFSTTNSTGSDCKIALVNPSNCEIFYYDGSDITSVGFLNRSN